MSIRKFTKNCVPALLALLATANLAAQGVPQTSPQRDPSAPNATGEGNARGEGQEAEAAGIVTSPLDEFGLVVKMRPILPEITTADPLRIAIHFPKKTGPVQHSDEKLAQQLVDRYQTVASMDIAVKSPGGKWQIYQPQPEADAQKHQSTLLSNGTFLLQFGPEAIQSLRVSGQEEFSIPWDWKGMLQPGEYEIAVRGTLHLSTRQRTVRRRGEPPMKFPATETDVAFKTKPISIAVKRADMRSQSLEDLARAAVEAVKERPEVAEENLNVQGAESIPIADNAGNRVIRVRANLPPPPADAPRIAGGRGYWQYEVAMSPAGKPQEIRRWRKGFCLARGTIISTPDGDVTVEDLRSGRQVWAYDFPTRSLVPATVLAVFSSRTDETIVINDELRLSADHPVCIIDEGGNGWRRAAQLQVGEKLLNSDGQAVPVATVESVGGNIDVYDVAVDGPHNFFAAGLLVHNKSIAWTPEAFVPWYALWKRAPKK